MPLDPQIESALAALAKAELPPIEALSPLAAREQMGAMSRARGGVPAEIGRAEDRTIPGPAGDLPIRIYWPKGENQRSGAVLYFHGGGHVIGDLDTHDKICRNLTAGSDAIFVSVDYRMGPEDKFPAAVDDAWAALQWLMAAAESLGADPERLAVAGDSAGGNLATVAALMARDAGGPKLRFQALVYPVVDYGLAGESYGQFAEGYGVLTKGAMEWFRRHYLNADADARDWRASPMHAENLAGSPPALIVAAECDVLVSEGKTYAAALEAAGVSVDYEVVPGMIHGFFGMAPDVDGAVRAQARVAEALRTALA